MRKALLVLLLVGIVLVAGCMGGTTEKTASGEETGTVSETQKETSTVQESPGEVMQTTTPETTSQPQERTTDIADIGTKAHIRLFNSSGLAGIEVHVDGATWVSNGNAYNTLFDYAPMFYSGGNLYIYQYVDESFSQVYTDGTLEVYPFIVLKMPVNGVEFTFAGPQDSILTVGTDGKLYLIVYDLDERKNWPSDDDKKIVYFYKTKRVESWDLNVKHVAAGSEKNDEYVYYVAWNGNEVYVIGWDYENLLDFTKGEGQKAEAKRFSFDNVRDVLIGKQGIYVLSGGKLYVMNTVDGPDGVEVSAEFDVGENAQLSLDEGGDYDLVSLYDGKTLKLMVFEDGKLDEDYQAEIKLEGYESVYVYLPSSGVEFVALKGNRAYFYTFDFTYRETTLAGYLDLPVKPVWASGYIDGWDVGVITFWGDDGKYYRLFEVLKTSEGESQSGESEGTAGESGGSGTSSGTSGESGGSTSTGTPESGQGTEASFEGQLKNFLENAYTVEGLVYSRDGYNYRGVKITPKTGKLYYFPYGDESVLFLIECDKVIWIVPWDLDFFEGSTDNPRIDPHNTGSVRLILLPARARLYYSVPNDDIAMMVDKSGKLHILAGWEERHSENDVVWETFKGDAVYDFDAEGLSIYPSYWDNHEFIVWKGTELRVYIYDGDTLFHKLKEGINVTVEPKVYTLPERIREVNPYLPDDFIVVLTEGGTYLIPDPLGHYSEDTNVYRIDDRVDLIGAYHYWYLDELLAYSNGQLYGLAPDYSDTERKMTIEKGPYVSISNVVGLYGDNDQDEHFALSTSDGTLMVYQRTWNNQRQAYEFALRKTFYLPAPLVKFTFDYRPEWDWIKVLGLGADGSFYNFEIQGGGS